MRAHKPAILILAALLPTALVTMAHAWTAYGGGAGGGQYSPLAQLTVDNVQRLAPAWIYHTGELADGSNGIAPTTFEVNPIFVNNALYFCTPYGRVVALRPDTGQELWSFDPGIDRTTTIIGAHICRGVSYWEDARAEPASVCRKRVFHGVADGRLIALDADTGRRCEDFGQAGEVRLDAFDYHGHGDVGLTSPPAVVRDRVVVGASFPSYEKTDSVDGIVRAFDARTGGQVWSWNPIPPSLSSSIGGANVWAPISVDRARGLVFVPTTSPTPDIYGVAREEPVPYANAVVALNADSGTVQWHFQTVHHDLFDYDLPAQPLLVELQRGNATVPAVVQVTKTGFVFVLHRETGEPVFARRGTPGAAI